MKPLFFVICVMLLSTVSLYSQTPEENLKKSGIELPVPQKPVANYVNAVRTGNLIFLAGKGPSKPDGSLITGKVGKDLTVQQGYEAARLTAINQLAVLRAELGSLNKVKRIVKVLGMVNCTPDFEKHPYIINGCSELFKKVWGDENGVGVRSAVGMGSLPDNIPVEIEAMFELY